MTRAEYGCIATAFSPASHVAKGFAYSGINVPLVAVSNVPLVAVSNVPAVAE